MEMGGEREGCIAIDLLLLSEGTVDVGIVRS